MRTDSLTSLIFSAMHIIQRRARGSVSPISLVQLKTLAILSAQPSMTMKEIADVLRVAPPSATVIVRHLVEEGSAERIYDTKDRRVVRLRVTAKGAQLLKKRREQALQRMNEILGKLSEKEKVEFANILKKIIKSYSS